MRGVTGVVPMIRAAMSGENRARRAASGNCSRHIELTHAAQTVVNGSIDAGTPVPENKPAFDGDKDLLHRAFDKGACDMVHTFRKMLHERALDVQDTAAIIATAPYQGMRPANPS